MFKSRLRWREMLPIVTRELRVASKRRVTYRLRWIVALVGGLCVIFASTAAGYSVEAGQFVFWTASALMVFICAAAGLLLTADSVSREKREGTLGLLFLTRLTSADVILGKLTAGVLSGGAVAFAGLPFLAFSLCLGGVTARELWEMSAALLFLLAYSLTLGIFVSTLFRREAVITFLYCLCIAGPFALTPLAILKWKAIPTWLAKINPLFPVQSLGDRHEIFYTRDLATNAVFFQSLAIPVMLIISFVVLPWAVRGSGVLRKPALNLSLSRFAPARRWKAANMDRNPVAALSRRHLNAAALCVIAVGLYVLIRYAVPVQSEAEAVIVLLMAFLPKLLVLWHASGAMAVEKQSGFLESLLTTPLTAAEVLRGKMTAIKSQITPALLFAMIALWAISTKWWGASGHITVGATVILAAMIALLIDIHSIGWVGLWLGLTARDRRRALVSAALVGLILPWVPGLVAVGLLVWILDGPQWLNDARDIIPILMICANVVSFGIACFAMARVHDKFRSTATQTWAARGRTAAA